MSAASFTCTCSAHRARRRHIASTLDTPCIPVTRPETSTPARGRLQRRGDTASTTSSPAAAQAATCVRLDISRTHSLVASGSHTPFLRRPRASCGASTRSHNTPLRADLLEEHADAYAAQSSPSSKQAQGGKFHQLSGDFHHNLVILVAGGIYRSRRRKYDVRREHFVFASGRSRCHRHQRPCSLLTRS